MIKKKILFSIQFFFFSFTDIRICNNRPNNYIRFGARPSVKPYHPLLQPIFNRVIVDPTKFLQEGYYRQNLCIPANLILQLYCKLGPGIHNLSMIEMRNELKLLPYQKVLNPFQGSGLTLPQLTKLEDVLSPIPIDLIRRWPALEYFQGFAINLFSMKRQKDEFRLFPLSISRFSRQNSHFQVDLLLDNCHVRPEKTVNLDKKGNMLHCLLIKNITSLLGKFSNPNNVRRNRYICKTCLKLYYRDDLLQKHYSNCGEIRRGVSGRRRANNQLLHKVWKKNKFNGKLQRNGLVFKRSDVGKMLKPLCFVTADYESYSVPLVENKNSGSNFEKTPPTAISVGKPMCFAWSFRCNYPELTLPASLTGPRVIFHRQEDANSERSFFLSIFLEMRQDLLSYNKWITELFLLDQPPPAVRYRSPEMIQYFRSVKFCQLCGIRFGRKKWSVRSQSYYVIKRCFDHDHILSNR